MSQKIINGIIHKIKISNLIELLVDRLSFGELQSLLLKVFELKTRKRTLKDILSEYRSNRFTKPSDINPILHRNLELGIFLLLPNDFELIDLSPLTPLGTTYALTTVHQNNVVSTIKNVEVAADTTNILALECARRRSELLRKDTKSTKTVKLCSSQRVTRGQPFDNKNFSAYFNVIGLCTAGKDEGNDKFEMINLEEHIMFYTDLLAQMIEINEVKKINIKFFCYEGFDSFRLIENIKRKLADQGHIFFQIEENSEFGKSYYSRLRFMISVVNQNNQEFDYIDGGFTDWISRLLSNKKERLLTSGIGTDFLLRTIRIKTSTARRYNQLQERTENNQSFMRNGNGQKISNEGNP